MKINFEFQSEGVCRIETNDISRISSVTNDAGIYDGKYSFSVFLINRKEPIYERRDSEQECENKRNELIKLWYSNNSITRANIYHNESDETFIVETETIFRISPVIERSFFHLPGYKLYTFYIYFNGGDMMEVYTQIKEKSEERREELVKVWMNNN